MAVYAIGDVQGCYDVLMRLLERLEFDPNHDQIWLTGDLVNRGPKSVDVLRFAREAGSDVVKVVLGNHDLHLLANAAGYAQKAHPLDTLQGILDAHDREELITWLRHQPLFYHDAHLGFSMVHAGVPPQWDIATCLARAAEVEQVLRGDLWWAFFERMYGNKPKLWSEDLRGWDRMRYITNAFTRLRYCKADGRLALKFKGAPEDRPAKQTPWFEMPDRRTHEDKIVFGHWSMLGTGRYGNVFSLDSGAVWGASLTAVRIDKPPYEWVTVESNTASLDNPVPDAHRWS